MPQFLFKWFWFRWHRSCPAYYRTRYVHGALLKGFYTVTDNPTWLQLHKRSGENSLGASLIRLARLAASAHSYQVAVDLMDDDASDTIRVGSRSIVQRLCTDADRSQECSSSNGEVPGQGPGMRAVYTEVNR